MSIGNATIRETSQLPAAYRSRRGPNWAGEVPDSSVPASAGREPSAVRREELDEVGAALAQLPAHFRAALCLRHFQQLSYQEVADALGIPLGTVKTHLHRARAALKVRLAARAKERSA